MTTAMERELEEVLIAEAKAAISGADWVVGRCAVAWCQRHARGRTDADFGAMIGRSGDYVFRRRRVWELFGGQSTSHPDRVLEWGHFYAALTWSDAVRCLDWADENQATIAEMKAWRRLQNGEDLSVEPIAVEFESEEVPHACGTSPREDSMAALANHDPAETAYAPFRSGGRSPDGRGTRQAADDSDAGRKAVRGLATTVKRLLSQHCHLRFALADQLVLIADQLRADDEVTGMDASTLESVIRMAVSR